MAYTIELDEQEAQDILNAICYIDRTSTDRSSVMALWEIAEQLQNDGLTEEK